LCFWGLWFRQVEYECQVVARPNPFKLIYQIFDVIDDCCVVLWVGEFAKAHVMSPFEDLSVDVVHGMFRYYVPAFNMEG
jgi:hypothetical protein